MEPNVQYIDHTEGVVVITRHVRDNIYSIHEKRPSRALVKGEPYPVIMSELYYDLAEEARNGGC